MIWEEDPVQSGLSRTVSGAKVSWNVANVTSSDGQVAVALYIKTISDAGIRYVRPGLSLDDAEAIGYSLLYAVKLRRDKEAGTDA